MLLTRNPLVRKSIAEAIGTYALVFSGTGAIVINEVSGGAITHVGIALTFGLIVLAMIYSIGDVSGCHLNPAVTIAFAIQKKFRWSEVAPYVLAQTLGAMLASLSLHLMFPENKGLGGTVPAGSASQSFSLELILTCILMFVILSVSREGKERGIVAGIVVGSVIALEAMFAGPICGASMNPARSLAPAVVSRQLDSIWIYLTAPTLGAILGAFLFQLLHSDSDSSN